MTTTMTPALATIDANLLTAGSPRQGKTFARPDHPRVWLVAGLNAAPVPVDLPTVRDDLMRTWEPGMDGRWHTTDGYHHATWTELHNRFDLVEVTR